MRGRRTGAGLRIEHGRLCRLALCRRDRRACRAGIVAAIFARPAQGAVRDALGARTPPHPLPERTGRRDHAGAPPDLRLSTARSTRTGVMPDLLTADAPMVAARSALCRPSRRRFPQRHRPAAAAGADRARRQLRSGAFPACSACPPHAIRALAGASGRPPAALAECLRDCARATRGGNGARPPRPAQHTGAPPCRRRLVMPRRSWHISGRSRSSRSSIICGACPRPCSKRAIFRARLRWRSGSRRSPRALPAIMPGRHGYAERRAI